MHIKLTYPYFKGDDAVFVCVNLLNDLLNSVSFLKGKRIKGGHREEIF